jgi:hypothetical protein
MLFEKIHVFQFLIIIQAALYQATQDLGNPERFKIVRDNPVVPILINDSSRLGSGHQ